MSGGRWARLGQWESAGRGARCRRRGPEGVLGLGPARPGPAAPPARGTRCPLGLPPASRRLLSAPVPPPALFP